MTNTELAEALKTASEVASKITAPGILGIVGQIASTALKAASIIAGQGRDPVIEIRRILRSAPAVSTVEDEWDGWIRKNFPGDTLPPPPMAVASVSAAPDTQPSSAPPVDAFDPYEDM